MANSTLANLTASGALTGSELFYSDNGSADVKVTANQLKAFIVGAGAVSVASGKTLTVSNTLTLAGTDGATLNVGAGGTLGTAAFVNTGTSGGTVPLLNAANTFSAVQTITPAANTQALIASSYSVTGANAQALLDLSGTWNTSGNPTGVLLNLTQTAAGTTSKFADFQLGGTSKINLATGSTTPTALLNIAGANFGGWQIINGSDAGVTNNYEYLSAYVSSNIWIIDSGKIGTGTARTLRFQQAGQVVLDINSSGSGQIRAFSTSAILGGGLASLGYTFSTTSNFGMFFAPATPLPATWRTCCARAAWTRTTSAPGKTRSTHRPLRTSSRQCWAAASSS